MTKKRWNFTAEIPVEIIVQAQDQFAVLQETLVSIWKQTKGKK